VIGKAAGMLTCSSCPNYAGVHVDQLDQCSNVDVFFPQEFNEASNSKEKGLFRPVDTSVRRRPPNSQCWVRWGSATVAPRVEVGGLGDGATCSACTRDGESAHHSALTAT
jgi:hypothetical protein